MLTDLKPYPEMKDSDVEWLGEVPVHWEVRRLASLGTFLKGKGGNKDDEVDSGVPCIRYGDLYTTHQHFIHKSRSFVSPERAAEYAPIKFGDLLFAASGETVEEIGKSAVNLIHADACCGGDIILFRPHRKVEARFLGYVADCRPAAIQKATMGRGFTVVHIYANQLRRLNLALPPLAEQAAIVRFLDDADRRIQRYIRAKEKLIALLEEQKQAIIHEAVTGRIDVRTGKPYPTYKPSGIEWLGEVPDHWFIRRLCTLASITTGERDTVDRQDGGRYPFFVRSQTVEKMDSWSFDGEAVLTAGDGVGVGRVFHYVNGKFDYHQRVYKFSDFCDISGQFFFEYLRAMLRFEVMQGTAKATVDSLRLPMLRNFEFALPPLHEQSAIVHFLNDTITRTDHGLARMRREVGSLRECRTRLIADVVTGKVDVREAAAALPEKPGLSGNDRAEVEDAAGIPKKEALEMTDWDTCPAVERKPGKVSGAWVFAGTRIPLSALYENLASGATIDEFVEWFPGVDEQQVRSVLEHEAKALRTATAT